MKVADKICVINAGGWGTALSVLLADKGSDVRLWARRPELAQLLASTRENPDYLAGVRLPDNVVVTSDLSEAVAGVSVVLVTVISRYMRPLASMLAPLVSPHQVVANASKGLDPATLMRGSEILEESLGISHRGRVAALSGPNLAREVAAGMPTATVVACPDAGVGRQLQSVLSTRTFRVYTNPDIVGVELCGAMKNVVALAAGMADGLGYGDNSKAAIITRSLAEVGRLVHRMGGSPMTVAGLAGIGDIIATCASRQSRNRAAGEAIARGRSVAEVQASTPMVAEGIPATDAVMKLADSHGVDMPITRQVHAVLYEGISPHQGLAQLMGREFTSEPWL
jgi:glycerol-3-phosphate dehydrogenase (NAD(P)+)